MKQIVFKVDGMMCGMCEAHVNDAVRKAANVKSVSSSHADGETVVVCDDSVDAALLKGAIEADGYAVSSFSEEPYEKKGLFGRFKKKA